MAEEERDPEDLDDIVDALDEEGIEDVDIYINTTADEPEERSGSGLSRWVVAFLIGAAAVVAGILGIALLRSCTQDNGGGGSILPPTGTAVPGDDSWSQVQAAGKIVVGSSLDYPPFSFRDAAFQPDGFDIALMREIAVRLGVQLEIRDMAFDGLAGALAVGQIDAAIAAISVTPEREAVVDFSSVYYVGEEGTLARQDSPISSIVSVQQMAGQRVGVQRGSVYETWLQRSLVDTGLTPAGNLLVYETADAAVRDLVQNRLDLVVLDRQVADEAITAAGVKLVGSGLFPQRYAIAAQQGAQALISQINGALLQLQNEGRLAQLTQQYLGTSTTPPLPTATPIAPPTATSIAPPTAGPCVNGLRYIDDLNLDDNNMQSPPPMSPGQSFIKGWRVQNSGTCQWTPQFRFIFVSGNVPAASMGGQPTPVNGVVSPGQQYDMFVNLVAPLTPGVYQGIWQMVDQNNVPFGDRVWVGITVPAQPTATPQPTQTPSPSINFRVDATNIVQGQCVTFTWSVPGAAAVYFYAQGENWQSNQVPVQGSRLVCPPSTTTYLLRVVWPSGQVEERQITISVTPAVNAPQIVRFVADPAQVTVGQCVNVDWGVQGSVTNITVRNQFRVLWDNAPLSGNVQDCTGAPATVEYTIVANGPGGTSQANDYVNVVQATAVPTPPGQLPTINSFTVTPSQLQAGQCVQINWDASGSTVLVQLQRNSALVLDNAPLNGSAQDCLSTAGTVVYELVAKNAAGESTTRQQSVLVSTAPPQNPLADKNFVLVALNGTSLVPGTTITAGFSQDGRLNGSGGCNEYSARYTISGSAIRVSELVNTQIACSTPAGVDQQEQAYWQALQTAFTFEFPPNTTTLVMRDSTGRETLRYEQRDR